MKQSRQRVLAVLAGARINQFIANHVRQPECVIEFTVGKQSSVGGDPGTMKLKLQAAVEIKPQRLVPRCIQHIDSYSRISINPYPLMVPYGKCGLRIVESNINGAVGLETELQVVQDA